MAKTPLHSLRIDDETWERAKQVAGRRGQSLAALLTEMLRRVPDEDHQDRFEWLAARFKDLPPFSEDAQRLRVITARARAGHGRAADTPLEASLFTPADLDAIEELLDHALGKDH